MKNLIYLPAILLIALYAQACNSTQNKGDVGVKISIDSRAFLDSSIARGLVEVKASGLAITNSNNQRVIALAKMLIDDHTGADSILIKMEADKFPGAKDSISANRQTLIAGLEKQSGAAFDKAYLQLMVNDHQAALQLFTDAGYSTDKAITTFAAQTLPIIQMHLDSANSISASLK